MIWFWFFIILIFAVCISYFIGVAMGWNKGYNHGFNDTPKNHITHAIGQGNVPFITTTTAKKKSQVVRAHSKVIK